MAKDCAITRSYLRGPPKRKKTSLDMGCGRRGWQSQQRMEREHQILMISGQKSYIIIIATYRDVQIKLCLYHSTKGNLCSLTSVKDTTMTLRLWYVEYIYLFQSGKKPTNQIPSHTSHCTTYFRCCVVDIK